jgi:penicillin-insensitive murein endopeptidase
MKISRIILVLVLIQSGLVNASEAVGFYSSGKLKDGESIIEKGTRIHKLFLARKRFYGTVEIQNVISDAADYVGQTYPKSEILQVGDISHKDGGVCAGHGSHQNGLDVDIVYLTNNGKLQSQNAAYWEEEFVLKGKISPNFHTERNLDLFKYLVNHHPVERIFVDEVIKKHFCSYAKSKNLLGDPEVKETLRRLRVEKLHVTHFHMRLKCPEADYACKTQAAVPAGTGCN